MSAVIGIDTGANGAAVYILDSIMGPLQIETLKFGAKSFSRRVLFLWLKGRQHAVAYVEKVAPMPARDKDGKARRVGVKSMFTMGANWERPMMALAAADVKAVEVTAKEWQRGLGISFEKGTEYVKRKNILKAKAQDLFPEIKVTLAIADALLIAEYGRRLK